MAVGPIPRNEVEQWSTAALPGHAAAQQRAGPPDLSQPTWHLATNNLRHTLGSLVALQRSADRYWDAARTVLGVPGGQREGRRGELPLLRVRERTGRDGTDMADGNIEGRHGDLPLRIVQGAAGG